jgi:hypothetical protein
MLRKSPKSQAGFFLHILEVYSRVGRIWAKSDTMSWVDVCEILGKELKSPIAKSESATRSVIKLSRESSEGLAFEKNRNMGSQDATGAHRLKGILCSLDWLLGLPGVGKPNK